MIYFDLGVGARTFQTGLRDAEERRRSAVQRPRPEERTEARPAHQFLGQVQVGFLPLLSLSLATDRDLVVEFVLLQSTQH